MLGIAEVADCRSIAICGAGGLAKKISGSIRRFSCSGVEITYVVDEEYIDGSDKLITPFSNLGDEQQLIFGVGSGVLRKRILEQHGKNKFESISLGVVGESLISGAGITITEFSYVQFAVQLGTGVLVNDATVNHDCIIGDWSTIGPRSIIGRHTELGGNCTVGMGALVREGLRIVNDVTIGMGAVVVKDITEPGVYVGNPARRIK